MSAPDAVTECESRRRRYLEAMGITVWQRRPGIFLAPVATEVPSPAVPETFGVDTDIAAPEAPPAEASAPVATPADDLAALGWEALEARVAACAACELHQTRTQTVFGVGNREADWLVIGEAPGADEDRQGEPFVGRAGQLLNEMLFALGLERNQVYIANILKCRPPNNRDPKPEEAECCEAFLRRQIKLIQPRVILSVGRISAQNLLQSDQPVGRLRGQVFTYGPQAIPLVVTYHPAYLLRSPLEKRKAWQDLQLARRAMEGAA